MEFVLPNCGMLIMKSGKAVKSEGRSMPDLRTMKNIEEGGCKCLESLDADGAKYEKMKGQIKQEYIRRVKKNTKVKVKWKEYYFGHQFKSSSCCKMCSRSPKLDKGAT